MIAAAIDSPSFSSGTSSSPSSETAVPHLKWYLSFFLCRGRSAIGATRGIRTGEGEDGLEGAGPGRSKRLGGAGHEDGVGGDADAEKAFAADEAGSEQHAALAAVVGLVFVLGALLHEQRRKPPTNTRVMVATGR